MATKASPALWRDTMKQGALRSGAIIGGIVLLLLTLAVAVALASYHSGDPSLNTAAAGPAKNLLGDPGAVVADLLFAIAGVPVVLMLPLLVISMFLRIVTGGYSNWCLAYWLRIGRCVSVSFI